MLSSPSVPSVSSCKTSVSDLLRTLERTDAQCVTIFRNGSGHFVMDRSCPAFQSLPELSRFVDRINSRPTVQIANPS